MSKKIRVGDVVVIHLPGFPQDACIGVVLQVGCIDGASAKVKIDDIWYGEYFSYRFLEVIDHDEDLLKQCEPEYKAGDVVVIENYGIEEDLGVVTDNIVCERFSYVRVMIQQSLLGTPILRGIPFEHLEVIDHDKDLLNPVRPLSMSEGYQDLALARAAISHNTSSRW